MTTIRRLTAAFALGLLSTPMDAMADPGTTWGTTWLESREMRQDLRTDQGIATGSLTRRETARVEYRSARLDIRTDRALADGDLTRKEFIGLNRGYNKNSRFIHRQKHDGQIR